MSKMNAEMQQNLEMQRQYQLQMQEMQKQHNEEMNRLRNPNQSQQGPAAAQPQPERKMTHDELMNKLRRKGIQAYGERASRSWDQGAYDPQGAFWMQFWDFLFNMLTEVLLRAGYLDANKIAAGLVDEVREHGNEQNPQGRPPALMRPMPHR